MNLSLLLILLLSLNVAKPGKERKLFASTNIAKPPIKKNSSTIAQIDPVGIWVGTYDCEQYPEQGKIFYNLILKPDHTILTEGGASDHNTYYATGTWEINGNTVYWQVKAMHSGVCQSGQITISDCNTMTNGIWRDTYNPWHPNNGAFYDMHRTPSIPCTQNCSVTP
ncbi:MAG TPA: hypothetical protein VKH37_11680 [Ferruginibacter sp.]|nr:hypothetical protein [Ferruginibacter sp.]